MALGAFDQALLDDPGGSQRVAGDLLLAAFHGIEGHDTVAGKTDDFSAVIENAFDQRIEHAVHQIGQHLGPMLAMLHQRVGHGGKAR